MKAPQRQPTEEEARDIERAVELHFGGFLTTKATKETIREFVALADKLHPLIEDKGELADYIDEHRAAWKQKYQPQ